MCSSSGFVKWLGPLFFRILNMTDTVGVVRTPTFYLPGISIVATSRVCTWYRPLRVKSSLIKEKKLVQPGQSC